MNAILAIDTASPRGVALAYRGAPGGPVRTLATGGAQDHSRDLLGGIVTVAGGAPRDIAAIGVVTGPGSYAGLRVGIATAEGLALSLGVPLFGMTTFEALAAAVDADGAVDLIHPAGRGEFALLQAAGGEPVRTPRIVAAGSLSAAVHGEGAAALGGVEVTALDRAAALLAEVERRLAAGERPAGIEAYYLREPSITRPRRTPLVAGATSETTEVRTHG